MHEGGLAAQGSDSPGTMADRARVEWGETGFFDGVMQGTRRPGGTCGVAGGDRQCRREVACRDRGHHGVAACVRARKQARTRGHEPSWAASKRALPI
jgi:hypothetical protein